MTSMTSEQLHCNTLDMIAELDVQLTEFEDYDCKALMRVVDGTEVIINFSPVKARWLEVMTQPEDRLVEMRASEILNHLKTQSAASC